MPLPINQSFIDHLAQRVTTLATCIKINLVDGSNISYYFTDHDMPITYAGNTYLPTSGYVPSAQNTKIDLSVDNMSIVGIIDDIALKREDLLAGRFDNARARIFMVNYKAPDVDGDMVLINGTIGKIIVYDNTYYAEIRSLTQQLQQNVTTPYTVLCTSKFGDPNKCKVKKEPPVWQPNTVYEQDNILSVVNSSTYDERRYVVTSSTGNKQSGSTEPAWNTTIGATTVDNDLIWTTQDSLTKLFTVIGIDSQEPRRLFATDLTDIDGHYDLGLVTWTGGSNQYFRMDVKAYLNLNGQVELYEPMPFDIEIGHLGKISTGCDKQWETCKTRYDDGVNYRGFIYLPGVSEILRAD